MRVCLVSAPTITEFDARIAARSQAVRRVAEYVPLGILSLAAVLERRNFEPALVDLNRLYYDYVHLKGANRRHFCGHAAAVIASKRFDVVGFSTISSTYPFTIRVAEQVHRLRPDASIVLGGPQASAVDITTLEAFPFVDAVIRGEGEESFPLWLDSAANARDWTGMAGITCRHSGRIVRNPDAPPVADLDALPAPAFHLYPQLRFCGSIPIEAGRGCPYGCRFCSTNAHFRRRFRLKSPARLLAEMKSLRSEYGIDRFHLTHDLFTVDRAKVVEFCRELLDSGEGFQWSCAARTDRLDDDLIDLMASAGCEGVFLGVESGSPRVQRLIAKNLDVVHAASVVRRLGERGVRAVVSLITAFPGETLEDVRQTVAFFMDSVLSDSAEPQLHLLAPLAGTPIEREFRDRLAWDGIFSDMSFQAWRQDPADCALIRDHPAVFPNFYAVPTEVDREYLRELRDFVQYGTGRFRWLAIALHQDSGNLAHVFDDWRRWRKPTCRSGGEYYAGAGFRRDFLRYVRRRYLKEVSPAAAAVSTFLHYEEELARPAAPTIKRKRGPALARGVRLIEFEADYAAIVECLRRKQPPGNVPRERVLVAVRETENCRLEITQLSAASAALLKWSDGLTPAAEIVRRFASAGFDLAGIPAEQACRFGLDRLRQQMLLELPGRASGIS